MIGGTIVGSVRGYLEGETCYIGRLIVRPEMRNQGIGTRLMKEIEARFTSAERYELFTGERSEKNLYLYARLGYLPFRVAPHTERVTVVYLEKVPR